MKITSELFLIALNLFMIQISNALKLSCKPSIVPANTSPTDIAQIVSFIKSQQIDSKLFDDIAATEAQVIKDALDYHKEADNEDIHLSITQLINKYGYYVEQHRVVTPDGYILTMQRIPGNKGTVFLMHGLFGSADDFVTGGRNNALAYLLAEEGYDIWLGNARGNKHSRKHICRSPQCADFWDFSWDEIGRIDLPTMIDYALIHSCQNKLSYVGYSQGTTSFFVMTSERPEYNNKISFMGALAPVAFMSHVRSPLARLFALATGMEYIILKAMGVNEVAPDNLLTEAVAGVLCGNNPFAKIMCSSFESLLFGFDRGQVNVKDLPVIVGHVPAGSSTKQMIHYGQEIKSGRFCKFDYGKCKNLEVYGSEFPPDYILQNARVPVALYYSNNDWFCNVTDVLRLYNKLPNVVDLHFVPDYNHLDFMHGNNVRQLIFEPMLALIKKYSSLSRGY